MVELRISFIYIVLVTHHVSKNISVVYFPFVNDMRHIQHSHLLTDRFWGPSSLLNEGVSKSSRTESITK